VASVGDKVVFVTGTTGIAAATAELAIKDGARVFVAGLTAADGHALLEKLRALSPPGDVDFEPADLTVAADVERAVKRCVARFARIDALFNVAGISGRRFGDGPVHECTLAGWERTLDTNAKSVFLVSRAVLQQMLTQPVDGDGMRGTILNMASVLAVAPQARHFATHAYAASKGAILAMTRSMAAFYAPDKIRVNAIAPGLVRTPMSTRAQSDASILKLMKTKQPLTEDLLSAESVARAALFLLSGAAAAITGDALTVDGGWSVSG
jgi:NAD(P)-dependent dehydrogenase (short-subunit alcohol dehydrogenase family)